MDKVILLHGIFIPRKHLSALAYYLSSKGFQVHNIGYPSRSYRIKELAKIVQEKLSDDFQSEQKIHFVCFSMGGLILRIILNECLPKNLGRIVMIATPNQGSEVADSLGKYKLVNLLYGPALNDLKTINAAKIPQLPNTRIELGIIAGHKKNLNFFNKFFTSKNDGKVAVEKTSLLNQSDQIILPFSHSYAPLNRQVQEQTLIFLKEGKFNHKTPPT